MGFTRLLDRIAAATLTGSFIMPLVRAQFNNAVIPAKGVVATFAGMETRAKARV